MPLASFPIHNVKQRSLLRSRGAFLRPGFLLSSSRPTPTRGGRSAGRRTGSPVALARRDTALARRGPSRATGTAPLSAPPWRFSAEGPRVMRPTVPPDHAATSRAAAARPKAFGSRSLPAAVAPQSRDATPRSVCKTSPETPLMSEDESECSSYSIRSQYRSCNVVEKMRLISGPNGAGQGGVPPWAGNHTDSRRRCTATSLARSAMRPCHCSCPFSRT
jgi:hypothetical protein